MTSSIPSTKKPLSCTLDLETLSKATSLSNFVIKKGKEGPTVQFQKKKFWGRFFTPFTNKKIRTAIAEDIIQITSQHLKKHKETLSDDIQDFFKNKIVILGLHQNPKIQKLFEDKALQSALDPKIKEWRESKPTYQLARVLMEKNTDLTLNKALAEATTLLYSDNPQQELQKKEIEETVINNLLQKLEKEDTAEEKLERRVQKAILFQEISYKKQFSAKGTAETQFIASFKHTDKKKKFLAVIKPEINQLFWWTRLKLHIKALFGQRYYLKKDSLAEAQAERAAFKVSSLLNLNVTAPSTIIPLHKGRGKGNLQIFLGNKKLEYVDAADSKWIKKKRRFSEEELTLFQKFAIFDFLIGNLDRHLDNWKIATDKNGKLLDIKAIDNANSFPIKCPTKSILSKPVYNQYAWANLRVAKRELTNETKKWIQDHLNPKNSTLLEDLKKDDQLKGFFTTEMKELFILRLKTIYLNHEEKDFLQLCRKEYRLKNNLIRDSESEED